MDERRPIRDKKMKKNEKNKKYIRDPRRVNEEWQVGFDNDLSWNSLIDTKRIQIKTKNEQN